MQHFSIHLDGQKIYMYQPREMKVEPDLTLVQDEPLVRYKWLHTFTSLRGSLQHAKWLFNAEWLSEV